MLRGEGGLKLWTLKSSHFILLQRGVFLGFGEFPLSLLLLLNDSFHINIIVRANLTTPEHAKHNFSDLCIPVELIPLTSPHLTTHLAPLTPSPCLSPLGSFQKKCLISFALMDFQLWCKSFQDSYASLNRRCLSLSLSLRYVSLSNQTPPCEVLESTIQSHLSTALCLPSISLFTILCLLSPHGLVGAPKWQIQVRQAGDHQLWMKGIRMWDGMSVMVIWHFQELWHAYIFNTKTVLFIQYI